MYKIIRNNNLVWEKFAYSHLQPVKPAVKINEISNYINSKSYFCYISQRRQVAITQFSQGANNFCDAVVENTAMCKMAGIPDVVQKILDVNGNAGNCSAVACSTSDMSSIMMEVTSMNTLSITRGASIAGTVWGVYQMGEGLYQKKGVAKNFSGECETLEQKKIQDKAKKAALQTAYSNILNGGSNTVWGMTALLPKAVSDYTGIVYMASSIYNLAESIPAGMEAHYSREYVREVNKIPIENIDSNFDYGMTMLCVKIAQEKFLDKQRSSTIRTIVSNSASFMGGELSLLTFCADMVIAGATAALSPILLPVASALFIPGAAFGGYELYKNFKANKEDKTLIKEFQELKIKVEQVQAEIKKLIEKKEAQIKLRRQTGDIEENIENLKDEFDQLLESMDGITLLWIKSHTRELAEMIRVQLFPKDGNQENANKLKDFLQLHSIVSKDEFDPSYELLKSLNESDDDSRHHQQALCVICRMLGFPLPT